jgi:hypothetical protein
MLNPSARPRIELPGFVRRIAVSPGSNFVGSMLTLVAVGLFMAVQGHFKETYVIELFGLVAIFFVSEKIQGLYVARSEDDLFRDIKHLIESNVAVRCLGNHIEGLEYCAKKMPLAKHFQDTYFRTSEDKINPTNPDYIGPFYRAALEMMQGPRRGSFDCLVSKANMPPFIALAGSVVRRLRAKGIASRFQVRVVDHGDRALIGMQILHYDDSPTEVVFGWNFNNEYVGLVFATTDTRLVEYFSRLYAALKEKAEPVVFENLVD